jgi:hypothetical protein
MVYLVPLKTMVVSALRATFDAGYPQADFRTTKIGIEYPVDPQFYPGVWVDYDDDEPLQRAGIDHHETMPLTSGQEGVLSVPVLTLGVTTNGSDTFFGNGSWYWGVTAVDSLGRETTISNLVTSIPGGGSQEIKWDTVPFASGYWIYRSNTADLSGHSEARLEEVGADATSYIDGGVYGSSEVLPPNTNMTVYSVSPTILPFTRWRFQGTVSLTVVALSSLERDRLYDEIIRVLAFSNEDTGTARFRTYIENNEFLAANMNFDIITPRGNVAAPGTPWATDEIIYERGVNVDILGEFITDRTTGALLPLSAIKIYSIEDLSVPADQVPIVVDPAGTAADWH